MTIPSTMTTPVWVLLGFAVWTLLLLLGSVGTYRWTRILTRRAEIKSFRADVVEGQDWYQRAMRAHANCIENLPVYGAIVLAIVVAGLDAPILDGLAITLLAARVVQSLVHVSLEQTNVVVSIRFSFYFVQLVCMLWMAGIVAFALV